MTLAATEMDGEISNRLVAIETAINWRFQEHSLVWEAMRSAHRGEDGSHDGNRRLAQIGLHAINELTRRGSANDGDAEWGTTFTTPFDRSSLRNDRLITMT
jgi:hypothetical protein